MMLHGGVDATFEGLSGSRVRASRANRLLLLLEVLGMPRTYLRAVAIGAVLGCASALIAGLLMSTAWRASVVMTVVRDKESVDLSSIVGSGLGGIAAMAGLGGGAQTDRAEAVSLLNSKQLTRRFIETRRLQPLLAAALQGLITLGDEAPTLEREVKYFGSELLSIDDDKRTGIIELSITWFDREQAASWANDYVALANEIMRERAVAAADSRISYLLREVAKTNVAGVRDALYRMIESQLRTGMLANTREEFAYRVVDPAVVPDPHAKVRPRRALLALAGLLLGALAGAGLAALGAAYRSRAVA